MSSFTTESVSDDIETLVKRVVNHGGEIDTNKILSFRKSAEEGVGLFAKEALEQATVVMKIPYADCISVDSVTQCEALSCIFTEQPGLLEYPDEVLAIGLMHAALPCGASCGWADHVLTMPQANEINSTLYWTEEELEELNGCTVYHLTSMMKRQIAADWEGIHSALVEAYPQALRGATQELYRWALSMVYSRAVGLHRKNVYSRVIAPVLDLANHSPSVGSETADTFHYNEEVCLFALSYKCTWACIYAVYMLLYIYILILHIFSNQTSSSDFHPRVPGFTPCGSRRTNIRHIWPLS